MQAIIQDLATTFYQTGKGKDVLLLHGWGDSSKGMQGLTQMLSKKYRVTCIDLPGFGATQSPVQAWGLDQYASFVNTFCQKLSITPHAVIGHSNGGAIAVRSVAQGLKTDFLVLIASAGIRGEYRGKVKLLRYLAKTSKIATMLLPKKTKNKLRTKFYQRVGSDMLVAEHLQETFKKIISDDIRLDAKKINTPTLLIYGENDTSTPVKHGQIIHQAIKGSTLNIIPGADHWLPTQNTKEVGEKIMEYIS